MSADARTRFPVTVVEEQPERMVVIGDVHGDLGEHANSHASDGGVCPRDFYILLFVVYSSRLRTYACTAVVTAR